MRTLFMTLLTLGLSVSLVACGGAEQNRASTPTQPAASGYPAWTMHQSGPSTFNKGEGVYATGIGKSKITNLARAEACGFARVELAKYVSTAVDAAIEAYQESVSDGGDSENAGKEVRQGLANRVDRDLEGVGCVDMFRAPDTGEWYALAYLDTAFAARLAAEVEKALGNADNLDPAKAAAIRKAGAKFRETYGLGQ